MMYFPSLFLQRRFAPDPRSIFSLQLPLAEVQYGHISPVQSSDQLVNITLGVSSFVICANQHLLELLLKVIFLQPLQFYYTSILKNPESEIICRIGDLGSDSDISDWDYIGYPVSLSDIFNISFSASNLKSTTLINAQIIVGIAVYSS